MTARDGVERRGVLGGLAALGAMAAGVSGAAAKPVGPGAVDLTLHGRRLHVVDMTHELTSAFNFNQARPRIAMQAIEGSGAAVGMKLNLLSLVEHTGTHIDAPRHFANDGASLGEMPVSDLVVPLAIVDIRAKAAEDRNAAVTPDDIAQWERRHGRLPAGCCVAMNSGWDPLAERQRAAAMPADTARRSPGFSPEVADLMMKRRSVKGIAVDAMSIDTGTNGPAYPVHQAWLRSGRWGIEGLTHMDAVPAAGAILIVGAAPITNATGAPIRAVAIF